MIDDSRDVFQAMADLRRENRPFVLVSVIGVTSSAPREVGAKMVVLEDGAIVGTIGGGPFEAAVIEEARRLLTERGGAKRESYDLDSFEGMRCGGMVEVFFDPLPSRSRLVIVGAGHIGTKLARLAGEIDMPHVVIDDRPEYADPARFPKAQNVVCSLLDRDLFARFPITAVDAIAIVTRRNDLDTACLEAALATRARYIGMIGSRRRVELTFRDLERKGLNPAADPRVHAPIGLKLGDRTPGEVALAILAEVVQSGGGAPAPPVRRAKEGAQDRGPVV